MTRDEGLTVIATQAGLPRAYVCESPSCTDHDVAVDDCLECTEAFWGRVMAPRPRARSRGRAGRATSEPLTIIVHGTPAPQGSKRAIVNRHTGKPALVESSKERVTSWRQAVVDAAEKAMAKAGHDGFPRGWALTVTMTFSFRRPASHYRTGGNAHLLRTSAPLVPVTKPDWDKIARSTCDALTDCGVWGDDSHVVGACVEKRYAARDEPAGARLIVALWEPPF